MLLGVYRIENRLNIHRVPFAVSAPPTISCECPSFLGISSIPEAAALGTPMPGKHESPQCNNPGTGVLANGTCGEPEDGSQSSAQAHSLSAGSRTCTDAYARCSLSSPVSASARHRAAIVREERRSIGPARSSQEALVRERARHHFNLKAVLDVCNGMRTCSALGARRSGSHAVGMHGRGDAMRSSCIFS